MDKLPNWILIDDMPLRERLEIKFYKTVALIPVSITFCIYIYLFTFYVFVSTAQNTNIM